ncbi:MAG: DNA polymerase III subunit gamma/tau [Bradyrhizobium sp.]|nr:MAG: DNA polymerase III subunit gamma/tau [Bradyrhizobium sp.]
MTDETAPPAREIASPGLGLPGLGLPGLEPAPTAAPSPYRVLARKYRPAGFEDLIGQDAMVRTLANSFAANRVHQAYILTGVRGVGKTTTARILARAFNYSLPGKIDHPSVEMPELGVHCQAIIESRHVDVIEMDAASHTGIDDMREIIENARYRPVSARTKVYIIDEVHMLSKAAFNGLLKTLEEPPEHVKFLFATTEIEKVPVTVRSRCIRFDLKRIETELMVAHLGKICALEAITAEPEALALIARVAEGSVRDALSLLDQGIAHGAAGRVEAADIRAMLGLSDRSEVIDLFVHAMAGEIAPALDLIGKLHLAGADPAELLIELAEFCHFVTRAKLTPGGINDAAISETERRRGGELAARLALGPLTRAWQILIKGVEDVKTSPRPLASAEMALIRLAFAADLPTPEDALRRLAEGGDAPARLAPIGAASPAPVSAPISAAPSPRPSASLSEGAALRAPAPQGDALAKRAPAPPGPRLARFEDVVALARAKRDIRMATALEAEVRLARFEPGRVEFSLVEGASPDLVQALSRRLAEWTGERWMVTLAAGASAPTLREAANARRDERFGGAGEHPVVRKVLERFPGAKIVDVRGPDAAAVEPPAPAAPASAPGDDDVAYIDARDDNDEL